MGLFRLRCTNTLVLGGNNGLLMKTKPPNVAAFGDKEGFLLEKRRRLNVMVAWGSSQFHSDAGNTGSHVQMSDFFEGMNFTLGGIT